MIFKGDVTLMRMRNPKDKDEVIASCGFFLDGNLFANSNPIYMEIGMGKGDFILQNALENPDINYIGVEKYSSVASVAIKKIRDYHLPNLKIMILDIKDVPEYLFHKIDKIYLNFSDPWPKERHAKRRLTHENYLKVYDNLFKKDALIEMKTDNDHLYQFSKESMLDYGYTLIKEYLDLHKENVPNIMTEYERKFSKRGLKIKYLKMEKKQK